MVLGQVVEGKGEGGQLNFSPTPHHLPVSFLLSDLAKMSENLFTLSLLHLACMIEFEERGGPPPPSSSAGYGRDEKQVLGKHPESSYDCLGMGHHIVQCAPRHNKETEKDDQAPRKTPRTLSHRRRSTLEKRPPIIIQLPIYLPTQREQHTPVLFPLY